MSEQPNSTRRRRNNNNHRQASAPTPSTSEPVATPQRERRPRIQTPPLDDGCLGQTLVGRINDIVIRDGRRVFGFINIGNNIRIRPDVPRIFFSLKEFVRTDGLYARRGYLVNFECQKDDQGRYFAVNINLTEEGKVDALQRKADYEAKKSVAKSAPAPSATPAAAPAPEARVQKPKKKRVPREWKLATVQVSCDGTTEVKQSEVKLGSNLGRLKASLIELFQAPQGDYRVFYNNEILTRPVFSKLEDGQRIHLGVNVAPQSE